VVVYLSTSGVYGDCGGERVTESRPVNPRNTRAVRRVDAERLLARQAKRGAFRLAVLRVPGIYSEDRLPLARLRAGTAALTDADDVHTNHIHAADLAALTVGAMRRLQERGWPQTRIYNANDDSDLKMGAYFDLVADAFGLPHPPRLPRARIAEAVSPALLSFMRESRRLDNTRIKRELHVRLRFADVTEGVAYASNLMTLQA
jgi:nucleoside-diphosphate-sugar epimerase